MSSNLVDDIVRFVENMTVKTCTTPFRVFDLMKKHFSNFSAELSDLTEEEGNGQDETVVETDTPTEPADASDEHPDDATHAPAEPPGDEPEVSPASFRPDLHEERLLHSLVLREVLGKPLSLRKKDDRSLPEDLPEMKLWRSRGDREK